MSIFYILSVICSLGIFLLGVFFAGGKYYFLLDPASLLLVLFPAIFLVLANNNPAEIISYYSLAGKSKTAPKKDIKNGILFFRSVKMYITISGFMAFFLGIVLMFSGLVHMKDPGLFGEGLGASLVAVLYAAFIIMVFVLPFKYALEKKLNEMY
jgi:flagellar motor component MotA